MAKPRHGDVLSALQLNDASLKRINIDAEPALCTYTIIGKSLMSS